MKSLINLSLFLTITLFINTGVGHAQRDWDQFAEPVIDISGNLEKLTKDYPQQKLYLHTDKSNYLAGETIWYAAYLANATDHTPDGASTNLHVKLVDNNNKFISVLFTQLQDGYSYGNIVLPDSLTEGNYYIQAYTDWMRNFDSDFRYQKEIYVFNPLEETFIRRRDIREKRRYNKKLEDKQSSMQFAVFPEGGNMVAGLTNRIAFKATDALGLGKEASGRVIDSKGNVVYEFFTFHDGMGLFGFTPKAEEKYKAVVNFKDGTKLNYSLPDVLEKGYVLKADIENDQLIIDVTSNFNPADFNIKPEIKIVVHSRGKIMMHEKANIISKNYQASISIEKFPSGISHITVFDANKLPIAERLVFINHNDIAQVQLKNITASNIDKLEVIFEGYSEENEVWGSYSMAIIDPVGNEPEYQSNIASYLLLESDLASTLKDPYYYLAEENEKAIDLLMMTHGWRRFDWNKLMVGNFPEINFKHSVGLTISGQLLAARDSRPITGIHLELKIDQNGIDLYTTETTTGGRFSFEGLHYERIFDATLTPGSTQYSFDVDLDARKYEKSDFSLSFLSQPYKTLERGDFWRRKSRPQTEAKTFVKPDFKEKTSSPYGNPDQTIYIDDLPSGYNYLGDALRGRLVSLVSGGSFQASTAPLYMIDGNATTSTIFNNMSPQEIDRVEVFRGANTAVFGVRGGNGVIIAYSRTRLAGQRQNFKFEYYGYDVPDEFYQSRINTDTYKKHEISKTLFWEPQIIPGEVGNATIDLPRNLNLNGKLIIFEGFDNEGKITYSRTKID